MGLLSGLLCVTFCLSDGCTDVTKIRYIMKVKLTVGSLPTSSCIVLLYSLDSKPPPKSKPPVYNAFLMEKSFDESPFSKVSPRAYY